MTNKIPLSVEEIDCIQQFLLRANLNGNEAATFILCQQKLAKLSEMVAAEAEETESETEPNTGHSG